MDNPHVSLIIPTCNRAKFIPVTVERAINQSLKDIEIIAVDEESTDNTNEIETEKLLLQTVLDRVYQDATYYARKSFWLNTRLAELYKCLGEKWIDYGKGPAATCCALTRLSFDSFSKRLRLCWYKSFLPVFPRRVLTGVIIRVGKWAN